MEYDIQISKEVLKKIEKIDKYYFVNFGNFDFSIKLFNDLDYAISLIKINPKMYSSYGKYYRIKLRSVNFNIYYQIFNDFILIVDIKHIKQIQ